MGNARIKEILALINEKADKYLIIPSESTRKRKWDWFVAMLVVYNAVIVPFSIAFNPDSYGLSVFGTIIDFLFLTDVTLNFFTAYRDEQNAEVRNLYRIGFSYLKSWFVPDVLSSLPYDLFPTNNPHLKAFNLIRLLRLMRLVRMIRLWKKLETMASASVFRLEQMLALFSLIAHWFACLFFFIGDVEAQNNRMSWLTHFTLGDTGTYIYDVDLTSQYTTSLYWAMTTMITVGYGDYYAVSNYEKGMAILIFLGTAVLYASIFGNITILIQNMDRSKREFRERMDTITNFIGFNELPKSLATRIKNHAEHEWNLHKGMNTHHILGELPAGIRADVAMYLHENLVNSVPMFQNCERGFLKDLVLKLIPYVSAPNDTIINQGEYAKNLYFIRNGSVSLMSSDDSMTELSQLGSGSYFGDIALLTGEKQAYSIKALTFCDMFILSREDLDEILEHYPETKEKIVKIAEANKSAVYVPTSSPSEENFNSVPHSFISIHAPGASDVTSNWSSVPSSSTSRQNTLDLVTFKETEVGRLTTNLEQSRAECEALRNQTVSLRAQLKSLQDSRHAAASSSSSSSSSKSCKRCKNLEHAILTATAQVESLKELFFDGGESSEDIVGVELKNMGSKK